MCEIWCCYKVNIMVVRFLSCQYGNNSKQIKKKKTEKSTMLNISNKEQMNTWTRLNECQHLQNSKFSNLWDFDKVEDDINSFIAKKAIKRLHFWMVEEFWIYFICTAKIFDIFGWWRNFRSILFVLQNLNKY